MTPQLRLLSSRSNCRTTTQRLIVMSWWCKMKKAILEKWGSWQGPNCLRATWWTRQRSPKYQLKQRQTTFKQLQLIKMIVVILNNNWKWMRTKSLITMKLWKRNKLASTARKATNNSSIVILLLMQAKKSFHHILSSLSVMWHTQARISKSPSSLSLWERMSFRRSVDARLSKKAITPSF